VRLRSLRILAVVVAVFVIAIAQTSPAASKQVLVHYLPWYVAKPHSDSWGWHWTMNHFNPEVLGANGNRQIASWYYPLIGPYDSLDPAVLEYHVLLMKLSGIDGVIVDWYGMDSYNDYAVNNQRTLALLDHARRAGLKFSLCYEDRTIQQEINGHFITSANAISHAQKTFLYAQTNFFNEASYFRIDDLPVLMNFGPQYFKNNSDWVSIFSVLDAKNRPAFFTEDNRLPAGRGAFSWPPMWMSGSGTNTLSPGQLQSYLSSFEENAAALPDYVSSAFPRFHDIYSQAGNGSSYGYLDDANGATLTNSLRLAMTNRSAFVQLVTWNDFGEGTMLEPTREFGYRDLGIVQDLRRQLLDSGFPYSTNDLALAFRFYNLRKQYGSNPTLAAELNRAFTNLVSGKLSIATLQLKGIESTRAALPNSKTQRAQVQF
jgi:hypothetical protein